MTLEQVFLVTKRVFGGRRSRFLFFTHSIALGSVALSTSALLITLAVLDGFEQTLEEKVSLFASHVDVRFVTLSAQQSSRQWLKRLSEVDRSVHTTSLYTELEALISYRGNVEAALLHADTPSVTFRIQALKIPNMSLARGCAIGIPLAERLGVQAGDTVVLLASSGGEGLYGMPMIRRVPVIALFESGMRHYDESVVLVAPETLDRLRQFYLPTGISVWLHDPQQSSRIARLIDSLYGTAVYARSYTEIHPAMFTWIAMQKRPIPLVVGILSVVAAFNILTLLFVALVERRTTIATLRLIGMQRKHLIMLVSAYGLGVATIGFALGVTIALVFSIAQRSLGVVRLDSAVYFIDRLPIELLPWHIISVGIAVLVLTLAVLVLPALVATRISPLAIIRIR